MRAIRSTGGRGLRSLQRGVVRVVPKELALALESSTNYLARLSLNTRLTPAEPQEGAAAV